MQSGHLVSVRGRAGGTFVAESPPLSEGAAVGEPFDEGARAVLDMRVALETGAVLLAAERAEEADLVPLVELIDRMDTAEAFEEYRRADVRFHIGLAEAARSPGLVTAMTEMQGKMSALIARIAHPDEVLVRSNAQHRRLVAMVRQRDAGRAVRLMRRHIEGTEHILVGLMPDGSVGSDP